MIYLFMNIVELYLYMSGELTVGELLIVELLTVILETLHGYIRSK